MAIKQCRRCGLELPISEFHKDKSRKDGHHVYCKPCVKKYHSENSADLTRKASEWNALHPENIKAIMARYYSNHRTEINRRVREYRKNTPLHLRKTTTNRADYKHAYYEAHKENSLRRRQEWRVNHRDRDTETTLKRKAKKYNTQTEFIRKYVVYERDHGICYLCGNPVDPNCWHLEHKIPLSKGGTHTYDNVAVSHPICNMRKSAKILQ